MARSRSLRAVSDAASLSRDPIVAEARERFNRASEWEATARQRFVEDIKFANGDSDNGYQWPNSTRRQRDLDDKPCLTMNVIRQHNLQIINQGKQNPLSPRVRPMGGGATVDSAQIIQQLIRHVELQSAAQHAYDVAREFQVDGGIGWWRIVTDYASPETFDQEIYLREVWDPLSVFMDYNCQRQDCLDARFAFVFDTMVPRDEFEDAYPEFADLAGSGAPLGAVTVGDDWSSEDNITVCEYFRKVSKPDLLVSFWFEDQRHEVLRSKIPPSVAREIMADRLTKTRKTFQGEVEWYLIAGEQIIERTIWPGRYIPLIRILGRQMIIDGRLDRAGHTRYLKSAQHMYNWNASQQVEYGSTQGKTPWVAPAKAIEEYEQYWNTANTDNHSVLPFNDVDPDNPERVLPPPQRVDPPNFAPLYDKGMETAFNQMMMTSGQWQNQMGMMGNERTGRAIAERQEQSDTSVYHFEDNFRKGLITTAVQLIDLFPKIYDTKRVIMIQAEDGEDVPLTVDPASPTALQVTVNHLQQIVERTFNPNVGKYDVMPQVGPGLASKRAETVDAMTLILTQAPTLVPIIGDLLLGSMDFDKAQEAAQRLRRMVPQQALSGGPSQTEQMLQQQVQQLTTNLAKSLDAHGKDRVKLLAKDQLRDIDIYDAETKRMAALAKMLPEDAQGLRALIHQLVEDALGTKLMPILQHNLSGADEGEAPPLEGARKAPDGEWYVPDPTRGGRGYLRIEKIKRGGAG